MFDVWRDFLEGPEKKAPLDPNTSSSVAVSASQVYHCFAEVRRGLRLGGVRMVKAGIETFARASGDAGGSLAFTESTKQKQRRWKGAEVLFAMLSLRLCGRHDAFAPMHPPIFGVPMSKRWRRRPPRHLARLWAGA